MAVNYQREEYENNLAIWQKCRDVCEGQEVIHAQGDLYLPKLSGQDNVEYGAYVERALFYNATQRTVDAMSGLLFRKSPTLTVPKAIEEWMKNIDLQGNHIEGFAEQIADEILKVGRLGLLVEHPQVIKDEGVQLTKAEAESRNLRPFIAKYKTESIINWSTTVINNVAVLSLVVLRETSETLVEFEPEVITKYRVLRLDPEGNYFQQVWIEQESTNKKEVTFKQEGADIYPTKNGEKFKFIPFIFISPEGLDIEVKKSPILDLVNVNLSHYRSTADIEHGSHYTALPTAVVTGHSLEEGTKLKIGAAEAWVFSEAEAKAFYLEFNGQGLEALEKRLATKEQQMAALGARMLANEKAMSETAEAHNIKRQGENSALAAIASAISDGITRALKILSDWMGIDSKEIYFDVNKDYVPTALSPQALLALLQTWQSGGMAFPDFVKQLQKGEVIDADRTPEDIKLDLEAEGITVNNNDDPDQE